MFSIYLLLSLETGVKEDRKGFEDQSSSDFAHARVKEAHPQAREEDSQKTDIDVPDRSAFVKEYLEISLREFYSMTQETTDSGLRSQSAPSESELHKRTGNFIAMPCCSLDFVPR